LSAARNLTSQTGAERYPDTKSLKAWLEKFQFKFRFNGINGFTAIATDAMTMAASDWLKPKTNLTKSRAISSYADMRKSVLGNSSVSIKVLSQTYKHCC